MFPLQLLALTAVSTATLAPPQEEQEKKKQEVEKKKQEVEKSRYDVMFRRGDLLEVPRTLFTHFGIYLGGDRVAHFIPDILPVVSSDQFRIKQVVTNTRLILGVLAKCGSIRVDSVEDFAYGSEILVNPMDRMCSRAALQEEDVACRAEKLLGNVEYSLLWYNCEHYVMYCRYGTVMSFQTFQFCKTVRKLLLSRRVAKATALLLLCLLLYLGAASVGLVLLTALLPFIIWMAA
ncbi:lecithin retinol acyltransferase-like isoform X1 [Amphiprion ocellaris]|uniref:LRAT domain-containing protein n=1 Tax=Amphiprion ocellaris TaxID=80972 RepID=A0A3Q1C257_AMPOC|nr:lecithin retinol acyltransferase-like isoform X1 [Amphiprion ocellaris]XP_054863529.1 lecithin retinol acyltransferase-like isoform X1 [Amphiprion ocellaris]